MNTLLFRQDNLNETDKFLESLGLKDNLSRTRAKILENWNSIDITSCPGSGKTSMLAAKLAWAVKHWHYKEKGICVISHTNVAKEEIRKRLSHHDSECIFSYPHFVGTIHEFVNKYISLPLLRSQNIKVKTIEDDIHDYRAYLLLSKPMNEFMSAANDWWQAKKYRKLRFCKGGKVNILDGSGKYEPLDLCFEADSPEFKGFQQAKEKLFMDGYHCHEEMINYALRNLLIFPEISEILSNRFPLVFIDEAQDTSESQAELLSKIFPHNKVVLQRFGDEDQQIYNFGGPAITEPFPVRVNNDLRLNESQRCSHAIIEAAQKISLKGTTISSVKPKEKNIKPVIILFDENSVSNVLPKFVELIKEHIDIQPGLVFKAIGQIGQKNNDSNFPKSIEHYFENYLKPINVGVSSPKTLYETVIHARHQFKAARGDCHKALNIFFKGISRLLLNTTFISSQSSYAMRSVKSRLEAPALLNGNGKKLYVELLNLAQIYCLNDALLSMEQYYKIQAAVISLFVKAGILNIDEDTFFNVPEVLNIEHEKTNIFKYGDVNIELNTIAGVKGETHAATLVLETFFYKHNIENALSAIFSGKDIKSDDAIRIRHLFVAMTRPTDLLCIALPKNKYTWLCRNLEIYNWFSQYFAEPQDIT